MVNTMLIPDIQIIDEGRQIIGFAGSTLFGLETILEPYGREPHSVIGSSCIGASIVGGICIASVSELDFAWGALIAASTANVASAFRGQENKRVGELPGLKEAMGGTGNKFALSQLWATVFLLPTVFISGEYAKIDAFTAMWAADGIPSKKGLVYSTIMSGLTFYLYNEVSTLALNKISGVTHSVANTAKRAIIIVGCAIAFGESMSMPKMVGCGIAIGGTFFYAIIDDLVKPKKA